MVWQDEPGVLLFEPVRPLEKDPATQTWSLPEQLSFGDVLSMFPDTDADRVRRQQLVVGAPPAEGHPDEVSDPPSWEQQALWLPGISNATTGLLPITKDQLQRDFAGADYGDPALPRPCQGFYECVWIPIRTREPSCPPFFDYLPFPPRCEEVFIN